MLRKFTSYRNFKRTLKTPVNIISSPVADINIPNNILLPEYLLEKINKWTDTDKVAVECIETKRKYTYPQIRKSSLSLAHFLQKSLKLKEKYGVAILLPNLPEYPIILLASMQAGLRISTINSNYTKDEVKRQLIDSKAKVLFANAERDKELRSICDDLRIQLIALKTHSNVTLSNGTINLFDCITSSSKNLEEIYPTSVTSDDVVILPFSSGTTGLPKGVQLTHYNLVANLMQTSAKEFDIVTEDTDETILAFLPFFHLYGFMLVLLHGLTRGAKLVTFPKFTSQHFIDGLRLYRPTVFHCTPPVVHLMTTNPHVKLPDDLQSLRTILSGAAPLSEADVERFKEVTKGKVDILQSYGMTEVSPLATIQSKVLKGGIKIGGGGFLVPNTQAKFISIANPNQVLGVKENGELFLRGPQVMKGYLDNPEATKATITDDGWLRTGDVGHYDEDGHIFITDRLKELIKVQGFPVAPAELEGLIRDHPSVEDVAVIGVKHEKLGEAPKAFVVKRKNVQVKPEDIQEFIKAHVVKYKHLAGGVTFVDDIPKTPSGKILRKELKKLI
ncbi:hypothetical protein NQ315_003816 [Exocentrus adspersus]|uniref:4-coumarate--CoA ligase n=1 Tax=Exocentrus adspersus TaxID=1586481 RepID=A0AAV8VYC6_9CUCU|nr:hypothetical protein NQ315_003816 [Exocentrus adspersus]